jgi:hypothetical protein
MRNTIEGFTVAVCALFVIAVLIACKGGGSAKDAGPLEPASALTGARKDYVGEWSASNVKLSIAENGTISYEKTGGMNKKYSGTINGFRGDNIEVFALVTVTLDVQRAPHLDGDTWKMTIEGDEVSKANPNDYVEKMIQSDYVTKHVSVKAVKCPSAPLPQDCELTTGDNTKCIIHVSPDGKLVRWKFDGAMLDSKVIEDAIVDSFKKQRRQAVTAKCPPGGIIMKNVGDTFDCTATAGTKDMKVEVKVKDQAGNVTFNYTP